MAKSYQVGGYIPQAIWGSYRFSSLVPQYVINKQGLAEADKIVVGDEIWTQLGWSKVLEKQYGVLSATMYFARCGTFIGEKTSKVISKGRKLEIDKVSTFDLFSGPKAKVVTHDPQYIVDGLMIGDGSAFEHTIPYLNIGEKDGDYFDSEIKQLILGKKTSTHDMGWLVTTTITAEELPKLPSRSVPSRYLTSTPNQICSFLRGLFSANGSISANRVSVKSTNLRLICQVQIMLSSLGITSYYSVNKPRMVKWSNGDYVSKESYDLSINKDRGQFLRLIGFLQQYKMTALKNSVRNVTTYGSKDTYEVITHEDVGEANITTLKVYNRYGTYWCNCLNVCGT